MGAKYNITKKQANGLYRTMKDLHDILTSNDVAYWVTGGSLIGAVRHRGIVPWDDDGDVCIMINHVNKFRDLVPLFERKNYSLTENPEEDGDRRECEDKPNTCTWYLSPNTSDALGVDIFVMERVGPLVTYSDPYWRTAENGGLSCYFLYRYIFPLVPVRFGNFWVMTPFNAIEHLNQCYGTDWNSMSQRLFDHRSGEWINSKKVRMGVEDYATIPAPKSTCTPNAPPVRKCSTSVRASDNIESMSSSELRMVARLYNIKGRSKMKTSQLKRVISKIQ